MRVAAIAVLAFLVVGCGANTGAGEAHGGKIDVVTTFSTLNSFVEAVGGEKVAVHNLVPVGASPETYQPTPNDIATLADAKLIVQNGGGIEAWMQSTLRNAGNSAAPRVVLSDALPHIGNNPHLWMDPVNARSYVERVRAALSKLDPKDAVLFERNAEAYDAKLERLQQWIAARVDTIPPKQRAMIIFHNAFDYYNKRFGIRTIGVIELSPGQDPNPAYIASLVRTARANNVRAVFSEPEYSPKLADALAKSANIRVLTNLYDDSIGTDPRVHDYISMLRYDTDTIVTALK